MGRAGAQNPPSQPPVPVAVVERAQVEGLGATRGGGRLHGGAERRPHAAAPVGRKHEHAAQPGCELVPVVHVVGPEASDLISEGALAIEMGAFAEDISLTIHPHPTLGEAVMEAAKHALGEAIHIPNRKR